MLSHEILLVYDRQCPVCEYYCRLVKIRESVGKLKLVDARESSAIMEEITRTGLDIDQGMVLKLNDHLYYGADAINALAGIGNSSGLFNRFNGWIFQSKTLSHMLYPVLRSFRNLLLKMLRKSKINNLQRENNDWF